MCTAVTYRPNDQPAPCEQDVVMTNPLGLCHYHLQMFQGHMTPFFEDAHVRTPDGVVVYSPGSAKKRRKK